MAEIGIDLQHTIFAVFFKNIQYVVDYTCTKEVSFCFKYSFYLFNLKVLLPQDVRQQNKIRFEERKL